VFRVDCRQHGYFELLPDAGCCSLQSSRFLVAIFIFDGEQSQVRAASSHSRSCRASAIAGQFDKLTRVSRRAFR
jgi:hypothetical protein